MSDELKALQDKAVEARARANQLNSAITFESSTEERNEAEKAETAAIEAENAFADAEAKADTDAANHGTDAAAAVDAEQSRTGYAERGMHAGDTCRCPDGRIGTVQSFDAGLVCIPNADQGEYQATR